MEEIKFVEYDESFLMESWKWLNDPEIKALTLTDTFSKEQQQQWFANLNFKKDYKIWGVKAGQKPIGAFGLKNVTSEDAEYWGYIGEKDYWSKGFGKLILSKALEEARYLELKELYLKVGIENIRGYRLYERFGFIPDVDCLANDVILMRITV